MSIPSSLGEDAGLAIRLQPLTYVAEEHEVLVGRPDTGSYAVFPPAGADVLRSLAAGATTSQVSEQWNRATGDVLDVEELTELLADLGFLVAEGAEPAKSKPVRWQGLGRWLFSPWCLGVYTAVVLAAVAAMMVDPELRPSYEHFFFTEHIALIPILLTVAQMPLVALHEAYHALAARRLGLPSRVSFGRRFFYLVVQTHLDALYSVPRRQRYLPILAGGIIDLVSIAAFTLIAAGISAAGGPEWLAEAFLALALTSLLRLGWQGLFYLETDVYFALNTVSGCTDLHGAAAYRLRRFLARIMRRELSAENGVAENWSERDHTAARWYSLLMILGYGLSLFTLVWVGLPTAITFWTIVAQRFLAPGDPSAVVILDTAFFVVFTATNLGLLTYVAIRDWGAKRHARAMSSTTAQENA